MDKGVEGRGEEGKEFSFPMFATFLLILLLNFKTQKEMAAEANYIGTWHNIIGEQEKERGEEEGRGEERRVEEDFLSQILEQVFLNFCHVF